MAREKERKKHNAALWALPFYALLLTAALLLALDGRQVRFEMDGAAQMQLARGTAYEEPGCRAVTEGRLFGRSRRELPLRAEGEVDFDTLGVYERTYTARWLFVDFKAVRRVEVVDRTPPVITLRSVEGYRTTWFDGYEEEGFSAEDDCDGDLSAQVERSERDGKMTYTVSDAAGNRCTVVRELPYTVGPPHIELTGGEELTLTAAFDFTEPGYAAPDAHGNDLTALVRVEGEVQPDRPGDYELSYRVDNGLGDSVGVRRLVHVVPAALPETVTPEEPTIYLTFDDGPGPYTARLLDLLAEYGVKATFFVTCRRPEYNGLVCRAFREGHSVGVHSASHDYDAIYASEAAFYADFRACEEMVREQTGSYTALFRFPGGSSNTVSRFNEGIMTRLAANMTAMGYRYFDWNVDSDDAGKTHTTAGALKNVKEGCAEQPACVVLQHDVKDYSVAAVRELIEWGFENGYRFAALDMTSPTMQHPIAN